MFDVTLWHGEDDVASLLLPGVPQVGHRVILMDMNIRLPPRGSSVTPDVVDWTVIEVIWGCHSKLPDGLDSDSLRSVELHVIPTREAKAAKETTS